MVLIGKVGEGKMRKRCRELWNLLLEIKEGTVGLHRKMILFLLCMLLCVFAAIMVIFSIAGVFSDSEEELYQVLSRENQNTVTALTEQIEAM